MALDAPQQALQTIGSYDILAKIAEGGMGTVYKGRHRGTGEVVAIKIVPTAAARNPTLLKRFEREFTAARNLEPSEHRQGHRVRRGLCDAVSGHGIRGRRVARPAD